MAQQTGTPGGIGKLHCYSYITACTVFPKEMVYISTLVIFFVLCSDVFSFLYSNDMSVNKLQYKQ